MSRRTFGFVLLALAPLVLLLLAVGGVLFLRQGGLAPFRVPAGGGSTITATPERLAQGEYIARLGNCVTCHSRRDGVPFTGGRAFRTAWGTLHSTNLTPDRETGLGDWSPEEFRHVMRHGVGRNGVLYPAFPYAHFALLDDADLDALFAWLRQLPPSKVEPTPNRLEFPASWRPALIGWRMLHYRPPNPAVGAGQSAQWQRGRYLVDGLGHCAMCHSTRGDMGALPPEGYLAGGTIPGLGWYAPPLDAQQLRRWSEAELADYLRGGNAALGAAYGPRAEVVYNCLRHLRADDALAIAVFLKSVPARARPQQRMRVSAAASDEGERIYARECKQCHGADGRGEDGHPPLVDAVALTAPDLVNAVRMVLYGAMAPTTSLNPRPHSMPPFVQRLTSAEIAAVTHYIRARWGDQPAPLGANDVEALHGIVID